MDIDFSSGEKENRADREEIIGPLVLTLFTKE